jgi:phage recombination protein Bet
VSDITEHERLIREQYKDAPKASVDLLVHTWKVRGLDPLARQVYLVNRGGRWTMQTSIDGFRSTANRTGQLSGQEVLYYDASGQSYPVWVQDQPPAAVAVYVYRKGCEKPFPGIARFKSYNAGGGMWAKMGDVMLAKCAEALGLRKAFPDELSGLYTDDEMGQADSPQEEVPTEEEALKSLSKVSDMASLSQWKKKVFSKLPPEVQVRIEPKAKSLAADLKPQPKGSPWQKTKRKRSPTRGARVSTPRRRRAARAG